MTITVNFDALSPGTVVTDQFSSSGLIFTSPCAVVRDPDTFRHSLASQHQSSITAQPTRVIRARFITPRHSRLAVTARFTNAGPEGVHAVLRAFDAGGRQIDERSFGSTGSVARAEIDSPAAEIAGFEISGRTNRWDALDSVVFDTPAAADFSIAHEGGAEPLVLRPGGSATAGLRVHRVHGSHGEVLLAVTKACPGTTWCFRPAVVGAGTERVELVLRAEKDAPPAYHFTVHVAAVPRHPTAGRHEHGVTVPVTITDPVSAEAS